MDKKEKRDNRDLWSCKLCSETHKKMNMCAWVSSLLLVGAIISIYLEVTKKPFLPFWNVGFSVASYIARKFTSILTAVLPIIISAITVLLGGKNRIIVVQLYFLKTWNASIIMLWTFVGAWVILAGVSFGSETYCASVWFSFFCCLTISVYIICYFIRLNNDELYYIKEVCYCYWVLKKREEKAVKQQNDSKTKKHFWELYPFKKNKMKRKERALEGYMNCLFPKSQVDYNFMERDVLILDYFFSNLNFYESKQKKREKKHLKSNIDMLQNKLKGNSTFSNRDTTENNTVEPILKDFWENVCEWKECYISFEIATQFFMDIVIPITAKMRYTYRKSTARFLWTYVNQFEHIETSIPNYNCVLKCFLMMVIREYLIENDASTYDILELNKNNGGLLYDEDTEIPYLVKLNQWIDRTEQTFERLYGVANENECGFNKKSQILPTLDKIYHAYIHELNKDLLVEIPAYMLLEYSYMEHHKILVYPPRLGGIEREDGARGYDISDLLFPNFHCDGRGERKQYGRSC